jgi:hypothetical protein
MMFSLLGSVYFLLKVLGAGIVISALLGALVYHLAWRNEHPLEFWPLRAVLGFGGGVVIGIGLIMGSLFMTIAGVVVYFASFFAGPSAPRAAS